MNENKSRARDKLWYLKRIHLSLPKYSLGEEIFSAVVHGVSTLFAVFILVFLLIVSEKNALNITSVCIYGTSMILLYVASTMYHALNINKAKKVFQILDHCAIFLLIAGTYTPITLVAIGGVKGIVLFSVVWAAGILGIVLNAVDLKKYSKFSMVCYITMGWIIVVLFKDFVASTTYFATLYLIIGGICYTVGAIVYGFGKKIKYMHSIWHLFVLAGSACHFVTVFEIIKK
ncbi:MAG: hemolysin III family protein [Clostridia bacterium]